MFNLKEKKRIFKKKISFQKRNFKKNYITIIIKKR